MPQIQALPENWEPLYTFQKTAPNVPGYSQIERYYPIPDWSTVTLIDVPIIAILATSQTAEPHWRFAGTAIQEIRTGLTIGGEPDTTVSAKKFWLNQITLLWFPDPGPDFNLSFRIPYWIRDISLSVWNYVGPVTGDYDGILNQILQAVTDA